MARARHIAALALSVLLASPGVGLCAGWAATAGQRMACCVDGRHCLMHDSAQAGALGAVAQSDADSCCAVSEQDQSPSPPTLVTAAPLAPVVSPVPAILAPVEVAPERSHPPGPLPWRQVARYLLLSVFLV